MMKQVAITGGSGLVGSALAHRLRDEGHAVRVVSRHPRSAEEIAWKPARGEIEADKLADCQAVVHLAGESIFGRWTESKKRRIRESRVAGTRLLCETLAKMEGRPEVLVAASAVGYYGTRGDEILTETSSAGSNVLATVCQEWEAACEPAIAAGIRVVTLRIGPVLSTRGGMLKTLLPLFKLGLGGPVAGGGQWVSWIAIDDLVEVMRRGIVEETWEGVFNATAPHPVTNRELTRILGKVLRRPTRLPVPRFGVAAVLGGQGAEELALASVRALPARLSERGLRFAHPDLEPALRVLLTEGK